jgi:hypothetical protein
MGKWELRLIEDLAEIVCQGQAEGSIRKDIDPYQVAWTIVSRAWTEDVSYLMGIADEWHGPRSDYMLEALLSSIAEPVDESDRKDIIPVRAT